MEPIKELVFSYRLPIILTLVGGVLLLGGLFSNFSQNSIKKTSALNFPKESIISPEKTSNNIKVDVAGAVKTPGVYGFSENSRIEDAIKKAGGFSETAERGYISKKLNLSQKLSDGMKIYIPYDGENYIAPIVASGGFNAEGLIGINSADSKTLEALPGIGSVTAAKVISARPYSSVEELLTKKIVSKATFEKIKNQVDLN